MKMEKIKPVPKYIVKLIRKRDKEEHPNPCGNTRFYSYFTNSFTLAFLPTRLLK